MEPLNKLRTTIQDKLVCLQNIYQDWNNEWDDPIDFMTTFLEGAIKVLTWALDEVSTKIAEQQLKEAKE